MMMPVLLTLIWFIAVANAIRTAVHDRERCYEEVGPFYLYLVISTVKVSNSCSG